MKIQIISHTIKENLNKYRGRWSILPYYFKKRGNKIDNVLKSDWINMIKRYKRFNPDIIVTVGPIGALVIILKKVGIIRETIAHDWNDNYAETFRSKIKGFLARICENYIVKNADIILTPSLYRFEIAKNVGRIPNKELFFMPHGAKDHFFGQKKKIKMPGTNKVKILYVGEISSAKRVDLLVKAINSSKIDLILVGEADINVRNIAAQNIYFLGKRDSHEIPSLVNSADYLIVTEDNDSALKLPEYMVLEKPIIALEGKVNYLKSIYPNFIFFKDFNEIPLSINSIRIKSKKSSFIVEKWQDVADKYLEILEKNIKN